MAWFAWFNLSKCFSALADFSCEFSRSCTFTGGISITCLSREKKLNDLSDGIGSWNISRCFRSTSHLIKSSLVGKIVTTRSPKYVPLAMFSSRFSDVQVQQQPCWRYCWTRSFSFLLMSRSAHCNLNGVWDPPLGLLGSKASGNFLAWRKVEQHHVRSIQFGK